MSNKMAFSSSSNWIASVRINVNIFASLDDVALEIIANYDCYLLEVERNKDGTIGPHVSGFLQGNDEDVSAVLEELDTVMKRI